MTSQPPRDPTPQALMARIAELERQMRLLTREPEVEDNPRQRPREVTFSRPGTIVSGESSGSYLIKDYSSLLHRMDITANTAGTTDSTLDVMVNGSVVASITLPAGETYWVEEGLPVELAEMDRVSVVFSTAGSDLSTVTVHGHLLAVEGDEYD